MAHEEVLRHIIRLIEEEYVSPYLARELVERIWKSEKNYRASKTDREFAERITRDLFALTKDKHLTLSIRTKRYQRSSSVARTTISAHGIARIKISRFPSLHSARGKDAIREIDDAFHTAENARAVIVDIRNNPGGDGSSVALATSYLLPQTPQLLVWYRYRPGTKQGESWSWERLPKERKGTIRLLANKPVCILVNNETFSAAEEFAYTLQQMKRAVIIGERTKGGAHPSKRHIIEEKFVLSLPFAETISPYTNTNWEGTGIMPNIPCPATNALKIAREFLNKELES